MVKSVLGNISLNRGFAGGMAPVTPVTGVQGITGPLVDNTDPAHPVINIPTAAQLGATALDSLNTLVLRSATGTYQSAAPSGGPDVANKNYVDAQDIILNSAIALKATDTLVTHLAGTETITGAKTFSAITTFNGAMVSGSTAAEAFTPTLITTSVTLGLGASKFVNATSGALILTLPTASGGANCKITITKTDASANTVTVTAAGGDTINGVATYVLTAQYKSVTIMSIHSQLPNTWAIVAVGL